MLSASGSVQRLTVILPAGTVLLEAVAAAMDAAGCDSGTMILDGLQLGPYRYVMPGPSPDDAHAAWYSAKHEGDGTRLHHATAIVGKRSGEYWLHCHALWDIEHRVKCGHLLPDEVTIAKDTEVVLYGFEGGAFEVQHDNETNFDIFHVTGTGENANIHPESGKALIAKLAPHVDTRAAIETLAQEAGFAQAHVFGIGSLIGAVFEEGTPMVSPISEVLFTPGATVQNGSAHLPIYCVDPDDGQFSGVLVEEGSPVCVTFELMIVDMTTPAS